MKRIIWSLIFIAVCICISLAYKMYKYYAPPQIREPYQMNNTENDTLRIAYIGDSWAFFHKEYNSIIEHILCDSLHRPIMVHSFGICGLTSKEIYESLYDDNEFRNFLEQHKYNYCFISAGINDTYKKMSTSYYQKSMDGIIQLFLAKQIRPIIMEIPDYDIQKAYKWQTVDKKALRRLSMFINNKPLDCKQLFRDALDKLIQGKGYADKVSIIRYQSWNNDYLNDLNTLYLRDGMHLNEKGYAKLDSVIAHTIIALH